MLFPVSSFWQQYENGLEGTPLLQFRYPHIVIQIKSDESLKKGKSHVVTVKQRDLRQETLPASKTSWAMREKSTMFKFTA